MLQEATSGIRIRPNENQERYEATINREASVYVGSGHLKGKGSPPAMAIEAVGREHAHHFAASDKFKVQHFF